MNKRTAIGQWRADLELAIEQASDELQHSTPPFETMSMPEEDEDEIRRNSDYLRAIEQDIELADHIIQLVTGARFGLLALRELTTRLATQPERLHQ